MTLESWAVCPNEDAVAFFAQMTLMLVSRISRRAFVPVFMLVMTTGQGLGGCAAACHRVRMRMMPAAPGERVKQQYCGGQKGGMAVHDSIQ